MKTRILALLLLLSSLTAVHGQSVRIKWKQIQTGTQGQIAIVGTDGNGSWVTPLFTKWSDTLTFLATSYQLSQLSGNQSVSGAFNTSTGTITITKTNGTSFSYGIDGRYIPLTQRAAVNGVATLGADGKVPSSQLPAQNVSDVFVVASQAEMLALAATQGDFAVRTDLGTTFVLQQAPATTLANWVELPQAAGITSVNGQNGPSVTLTTDNVSEGATNKYFSNSLARNAVSATGAISYNSSTGVFSHTASGVTPGAYNNFIVDINGHITAGSNVSYLTTSSLTNYYTKTELQTSGQAAMHWNNITSKPSNLGAQESKQEFTGATTSLITLSNTPIYPGAVKLCLNGVQLPSADYSVSGTLVTLGFTRESTDVITANYSY